MYSSNTPVFDSRLVFFKHKTAYDMRISDWSSDVCSSDLLAGMRSDGDFVQTDHVRNRVLRKFAQVDPLAFTQLADELQALPLEIGRASCRERVCQYV